MEAPASTSPTHTSVPVPGALRVRGPRPQVGLGRAGTRAPCGRPETPWTRLRCRCRASGGSPARPPAAPCASPLLFMSLLSGRAPGGHGGPRVARTGPSWSVAPAGVHCEVDVDDCSPPIDPVSRGPKCFNNGTCVDQVGGYSCTCLPGFVGERCEGDVNECLSNPCDARGTQNCVQRVNDFHCECRAGHTGRCSGVEGWGGRDPGAAGRALHGHPSGPQGAAANRSSTAAKGSHARMGALVPWPPTQPAGSSADVRR